jgi:hypothetical protein
VQEHAGGFGTHTSPMERLFLGSSQATGERMITPRS